MRAIKYIGREDFVVLMYIAKLIFIYFSNSSFRIRAGDYGHILYFVMTPFAKIK